MRARAAAKVLREGREREEAEGGQGKEEGKGEIRGGLGILLEMGK